MGRWVASTPRRQAARHARRRASCSVHCTRWQQHENSRIKHETGSRERRTRRGLRSETAAFSYRRLTAAYDYEHTLPCAKLHRRCTGYHGSSPLRWRMRPGSLDCAVNAVAACCCVCCGARVRCGLPDHHLRSPPRGCVRLNHRRPASARPRLSGLRQTSAWRAGPPLARGPHGCIQDQQIAIAEAAQAQGAVEKAVSPDCPAPAVLRREIHWLLPIGRSIGCNKHWLCKLDMAAVAAITPPSDD